VQHRGSYEDVNIKGGARSSAFFMGCSGIELRRDFWPVTVSPTSHIHSGGEFCVRCLIQAVGWTAKRYRLLTKIYFS
jgi:hypothetical protein